MWRGVLTALSGRTDPEVEAVAARLYRRERAVERGELPRSVDAELTGDLFSAPIL